MNYLIIGAGGTGGCIAGYLKNNGFEADIIARNRQKDAITKNGLTIARDNDSINVKIDAYETPIKKYDIVFVCVKGYSLESICPIIEKAADEHTVIIPILNVFGTGDKLKAMLPQLNIISGCIYIGAYKTEPGAIRQSGSIFRIVFGRSDGDLTDERLIKVKENLKASGIKAVYSSDILSDTFRKFAFISPMAAAGVYLDAVAKDYKAEGEARDLFLSCTKEVLEIAKAMKLNLPEDMIDKNLATMNGLGDNYTASMQKDVAKGDESEMDGLVFEVCRLGRKYNIPTPSYDRIAKKFGFEV